MPSCQWRHCNWLKISETLLMIPVQGITAYPVQRLCRSAVWMRHLRQRTKARMTVCLVSSSVQSSGSEFNAHFMNICSPKLTYLLDAATVLRNIIPRRLNPINNQEYMNICAKVHALEEEIMARFSADHALHSAPQETRALGDFQRNGSCSTFFSSLELLGRF
ncbi:hypothetical protein MVEN_01573300 [Mycena venus]|uniref:Uncharacterized protein n=1 Tax=Mycena venus TaxID=2733690 RepID=A0A8H6XSD5_9AGAR|nr:hypothetical protein MVEN_01573300 [Mycena venus]